MINSTETTQWARRYQAALRKYLQGELVTGLISATKLGSRAVVLGMEILHVARVHELSLATWASPGGSHTATPKMFSRANAFFFEAIIPIEKTHRAARNADLRVSRLTERLCRRTAESSASSGRLKQSIRQRHGADAALKKSRLQHARVLAKAKRLQVHLQQLTHACLRVQEHDRKSFSRRFYDEIAQTLLAINLRLLLLKTSARASTRSLQAEVASTQREVKRFFRQVEGFAHEFSSQHQN